ncbi:M23 family metallopeptidase [Flavobacterium rhizosphaerae]|uniref:M23 family metallopeptidase n=1 Tax=Flavobacterium rhizosphaerae TaxID=3163298 RepID=A0ABW8YU23_9FLAO
MIFRFLAVSLIISATAFAQGQPYPENYFRAPMDLPVHASGTFGELRNNHFHAGLDYRTNQKEGYPVYAAANGYVSRIKVSSYGYGTCLYIDHPNGYTTVYGHLSEYAPKIDAYVRAKQYEKQSFDIELFPQPGELPVTMGEEVALSGNTGGSGGPHLHFEYRDTKTEKIINPLFFGLRNKMIDKSAPDVYGLMAYAISDSAVINESAQPVRVAVKKQKDGTWLAGTLYAKGSIGLSVNTTDKSVGSLGHNGVYKIQVFVNDAPQFGYTFDKFSFDEGRYVNDLIDYEKYYDSGQRFQKLFITTPQEGFSLLADNKTNGQITVVPGNTIPYRIEVSDFHGNKTVINGTIVFSEALAKNISPQKVTPYYVDVNKEHNYSKNGVSVYIPAHTFYDSFYMDFDVKDSVLHLHEPKVPVHIPITVSFNVDGMPAEKLSKSFIACVSNRRIIYNSSYTEGSLLSAKVKQLGDFKIMQDTTAPKIFSPSFTTGKWLSSNKTFSLKISDNLSGIATFNAWLNGKWILMHYDYKTRTIFHNFSDGVADDGRNDLKVVVTDNVGNSTTFETHFFRTQKSASVENNN